MEASAVEPVALMVPNAPVPMVAFEAISAPEIALEEALSDVMFVAARFEVDVAVREPIVAE